MAGGGVAPLAVGIVAQSYSLGVAISFAATIYVAGAALLAAAALRTRIAQQAAGHTS